MPLACRSTVQEPWLNQPIANTAGLRSKPQLKPQSQRQRQNQTERRGGYIETEVWQEGNYCTQKTILFDIVLHHNIFIIRSSSLFLTWGEHFNPSRKWSILRNIIIPSCRHNRLKMLKLNYKISMTGEFFFQKGSQKLFHSAKKNPDQPCTSPYFSPPQAADC